MDDDQRYTRMTQILDGFVVLSMAARMKFIELSEDSSYERRVAELALTKWQATSGWTPPKLAREFPKSAACIEATLAAAAPEGYPFVARTAVVDALRCVLVEGLEPELAAGIVPLLRGPVDDVIDIANQMPMQGMT